MFYTVHFNACFTYGKRMLHFLLCNRGELYTEMFSLNLAWPVLTATQSFHQGKDIPWFFVLMSCYEVCKVCNAICLSLQSSKIPRFSAAGQP